MKKLAIIMDTWTSIYEDNKNGNDIFIVPFIVIEDIGGKIVEYYDYIDITEENVLEKLEQDAKMSTSQPNIGNSMKKLDSILKEYEKVLIIPVSKNLSGTYASWETIVSELSKEDAARVVIKDFNDVGIASYNAVEEVLELYKNEDNPIELVIENLNQRMKNIFVSFITDDMNRLRKSGRVGFLKGLLAAVLKKKITIGWDGNFKKLAVSSKIEKSLRISLKIAEKQLSYVAKGIKKLYILRVVGAKNTIFDEYASFIKEYLISKNVKIGQTIIMPIANTIVTHLGAKALGLYIEVN